jgi:iron complex outermembrane receptor protein
VHKIVTFSGRITDAKSGSILPGASVVISNEDRAVAADSLGFFQFKNLRAGHHIVEVSFAGYASIVLHIDLVQNLEKNLSLQPLVVENQGVTVTGVAGATIIKKHLRRCTWLKNQCCCNLQTQILLMH